MRKINVFDVEYGIYYTIETGFFLHFQSCFTHESIYLVISISNAKPLNILHIYIEYAFYGHIEKQYKFNVNFARIGRDINKMLGAIYTYMYQPTLK